MLCPFLRIVFHTVGMFLCSLACILYIKSPSQKRQIETIYLLMQVSTIKYDVYRSPADIYKCSRFMF